MGSNHGLMRHTHAISHLQKLSASVLHCPCAQCNGLFSHTPRQIVSHILNYGHSTSYLLTGARPENKEAQEQKGEEYDLEMQELVGSEEEAASDLDDLPQLSPSDDEADSDLDDEGPDEEDSEEELPIFPAGHDPDDDDPDAEDSGEEHPMLPAQDRASAACKQLSRQIISEIANGTLHQSTSVRCLRYFKHHLTHFLPDEIHTDLPVSWYMLQKKGGMVKSKQTLRHFCPNGCRIFTGKNDTRCGICVDKKGNCGMRYDDKGTPTCEVIYFDLDDWITRILKILEVAEAISRYLAFVQRPRPEGVIRDSCDGSVVRDIRAHCPEALPDLWPFEQSNDGVKKFETTNHSLTPVVYRCHAFPPWLRSSQAGAFLVAVYPNNAKMTPAFFKPIVDMFMRRSPEAADHVGLENAGPLHVVDASGTARSISCFIPWLVNDIRGAAKPMMSKQSPAYRGACSQCHVHGLRLATANVTIYPGAVKHTRVGSNIRQAASEEFQNFPQMGDLLTEGPPRTMVHQDAVDSGLRAQSGNLTKEQLLLETHHGVGEYCRLSYFNSPLMNCIDMMHQLANQAGDIIKLTLGTKEQKFSSGRKKMEHEFGRFLEYPADKAGSKLLPFWRCPKENRDCLDKIVENWRLPTAWPALHQLYEKLPIMGSAEKLLFLGPVGVYLLQFCEFGSPSMPEASARGKNILVPLLYDLCYACELLQARVITHDLLDDLQAELVRVLAELEVLLPLCWNTDVRHKMLHMVENIRRYGPHHCQSMFFFERWHKILRKFACSNHHLMSSIGNRCDMYMCANEWQLPSAGGDTWILHPHQSTFFGKQEHNYDAIDGLKMGTCKLVRNLTSNHGGEFAQVQDVWAILFRQYDALRDRYRAYVLIDLICWCVTLR